MSNLKLFGDRVMERRNALGLSQAELAFRTGYSSRSSINKIEKGLVDVPLSKIKSLAKVLKVSETWLMGSDISTERTVPSKIHAKCLSITKKMPSAPEGTEDMGENDRRLFTLWNQVSEANKPEILNLMEVFLRVQRGNVDE